MSKKMIIAANWKMNKTCSEAESYFQQLKTQISPSTPHQALFFPSAVSLALCSQELAGTSIGFGAQNCHFEDSGAFTGEISAPMLQELKVTHTLVGHSERRHVFLETDDMIAKKVLALVKHGITPVLCVGEKEDEFIFGKTLERIRYQLNCGLKNIAPGSPLVIAYEPVWAIGTGRIPSSQDILMVHRDIRSHMIELWGDFGRSVPILYGGSVSAKNAKNIAALENVNGFLIGGASLKLESYLEIFNGL